MLKNLMNTNNKLESFINNIRCLLEERRELLFIKDMNFQYVECSQGFCDLYKVDKKNIIGEFDSQLPWGNFSEIYHQYDSETMKEKIKLNVLEPVPLPLNKNIVVTSRTLKHPIISDSGETIGVLGRMTILSEINGFGNILSAINLQDKKNTSLSSLRTKTYRIDQYNKKFKLTQRETECLFLVIRGKTAKEIARFLAISFRTVEEHIEHIREKMNVSTRAELITKAIEMGMLEIIPINDMLLGLYKSMKKWKDFLI